MAANVVLFTLFCALICGIGAEYFAVERDDATGGFKVSKSYAPEPLALGTFKDSINSTGWAVLTIETNPKLDDIAQAYAAGTLEGWVTRDLIKMNWHNTVAGYCEKPYSDYCQKLKSFLLTNLEWMYEQIATNPKSAYWHQIATQLAQINGITDGLNNQTYRPRYKIDDVFGIYLMHIMAGDTDGLEAALGKKDRRHVTGSGSCSALIKFISGHRDLYAAHDTWSTYQSMLRIAKQYKLHLHQTADPASPLAPGSEVTFSGYPGTIWSGDDFYTIKSGLVSIETTIGNYNASRWAYIKPTGSVLENFRATLANRLATNINEWGELFSKYNSGTYNNQWMIVDYNKFTPGRYPAKKGLLLVLEQLPGMNMSADKTDQLLRDGYWASFNIPYFPQIFTAGGNDELVHKYGDWFTHEFSPRNQIFARDHRKVVDMSSMLKMMRYNDYLHDPLSSCTNCTPTYNAENAISARSDLNPKNGSYPFASLGHRSHGGTDCKVTTSKLVESQSFVAVSGPTWDQLPAFKWSTADFAATTPHLGHPDAFQFKPVLVDWEFQPDYLRRMVEEPVADDFNVIDGRL